MAVTNPYERDFWRGESDYQKLAEEYEKGIETHHPDRVTSKRMCPCLKYCRWCGWAGTSVTYYRYNGESV